MGKMHADEVDIDISLVARLLAGQFPQWADLPLSPVQSAGTDNAIYRLGDDLAVRLPRVAGATEQVDIEFLWLPRLSPHLPLAIPVPLALGQPGEGYPWSWSVCRWLEGESAQSQRPADLGQTAHDLADFIAALQRLDTVGWPPPGPPDSPRGGPLSTRDAPTRVRHRRAVRQAGYRRRDRRVGGSPPGTGVAWPACLDPRRPVTREPAGP